MIRLALTLTVFVFAGFTHLPKWSARISDPFHQHCLKFTPISKQRSEIRSLVCGSSLKNLTEQNAWKNLGLIHILVVSGGHLLILSELLTRFFSALRKLHPIRTRNSFLERQISVLMLIGFALANRLEPPVLRALLEWLLRSKLETRGWRKPEIALITTWIALPFASHATDLLSLALSFFASVAVHTGSSLALHDPKLPLRTLKALGLQVAVWWLLLPWLFTIGLPHPITTLVNIALAPLLGATLIPLAMLATATSSRTLGSLFDFTWAETARLVRMLSDFLPEASSKISGAKVLSLQGELAVIFTISILSACGALLLRTPLISKSQAQGAEPNREKKKAAVIITTALILACVLHHTIKGGTAYIPSRAISRPAHK